MGRLKYFIGILIFFISILVFVISCNKNPDQTISLEVPGSANFIIQRILTYSDTVDHLSNAASKQESLIYSLRDYSFHVSRYVRNSEVSLYIEHGNMGEQGHSEKRYYLKDGEVVLLTEHLVLARNEQPFRINRSFYQNGDLLYSDQKIGKTENELKTKEFRMSILPEGNIRADLKKLNDAIYQYVEFDLVFDGITEYPKAKYLIFSKNKFNAYRASVKVEKEDDFIRAIFSNPEKYRGRKFKINWDLRRPAQAIYVSGRLP